MIKPPAANHPSVAASQAPGTGTAASADAGVRQVPCPGCGQPSVFAPSNRWRPFCSQRCRTGDLGAWATERYRVAAAPTPDEPDGTEPSGG